MKLKFSLILLLSVAIISCNKFKTSLLDDGTRIQVHKTENSGKYPKVGDMLTLDLEVRTPDDSLISSSYLEGRPIIAVAQDGFFDGSFESAIFKIAEGDSVTVFVKADSLFKAMGQQVPNEIGRGSDLRYTAKMQKIQTEEELKEENNLKRVEEGKLIKEYLEANMKGALKTKEGDIYYLVEKEGSGNLIKENDTAFVTYEGRLLDGTPFDAGEISVKIGEHRVIRGWEIALQTMKKGGKSTFLIPSDVAYGERNVGPIPAFSTLVFDITVNDIK